jgi:hypothetical protein
MEQGSSGKEVDDCSGDSGVSEQGVSVVSAKRQAVETRLLGQVIDYLTVLAFSHMASGRAVWTCRCKCGEMVTRSGKDMNKNRERGRLNGCATCVPSRRITEIQGRNRLTPEQREERKADARKRYEMKERALASKSQRAKKWYEPEAPAEKIVEGAVLVSGIVVGQARTAKEREWFQWAFGE